MPFAIEVRGFVRKVATSLVLLGLATLLASAGADAVAGAGVPTRHTIAAGRMTLRISSTMSGVTFTADALVCPPMLITTASGVNENACEFTIESTGEVQATSITVSMTVSGITADQVSSRKFAIAPRPGDLIYFGTAPRVVYSFAGAQLPVTVDPAVVWGANAGTALDNSDMGSTIVVTYTLVAESLEGASASPASTPTKAPTATPVELVGGVTAAPGRTATPPPTGSVDGFSGGSANSLLALLICLLLGSLGLAVVWLERRAVRH